MTAQEVAAKVLEYVRDVEAKCREQEAQSQHEPIAPYFVGKAAVAVRTRRDLENMLAEVAL